MTKWAPASIVLLIVLGLSGCVSHPVTPARSYSAYEGKARTTAASVRSSVATARLLAETAGDGKTFGGYAGMLASESEDELSSTIGTFDSIQPPNGRSQALRNELDALMQEALTHVTDVRIAARRGNLADLALFVEDLERSETALTEFLESHGAKS
ncbi:MAG: hypothetical protein ABI658_10895 [Acidimicrobiales bacterium]